MTYVGDIGDIDPYRSEERDTLELAKYPFLPEAGRYIRDRQFSIESLGTDPDLKGIIEGAYLRVKTAADGGIHRSEKSRPDTEIFSFLLAIVLLKLSRSRELVSKFVMAESRRAERYLEGDLALRAGGARQSAATYRGGRGAGPSPEAGGAPRGRGTDRIIRMIEDLFSVRVRRDGSDILVPVADYVRRAVLFHESPWKLVNRRVGGGMVMLTPHEAVRLIRPELNQYISERIRSTPAPPSLPNFEEPVRALAELAKRFRVAMPVLTEYPPCIKHAIRVLEEGGNLPHSGRFMLASYLLKSGQTVEQVEPLFRNAPDYNERTTLYQLKQIAGREYTCPSCEKIRGNDMCFPVSACSGIVNPLQFGRRRGDA